MCLYFFDPSVCGTYICTVYIDCWSWPLLAAQKDVSKWRTSFCSYSSEKTPDSQSEEKQLLYSVKKPVLLKCVKLYPIIMPPDKGNTNTLCIKGPWKIKQPISWQLFSLISWRQPMGMCLWWWRPGRDSCLRFYTFRNPNTYFALCSAQAKIKYRQTF